MEFSKKYGLCFILHVSLTIIYSSVILRSGVVNGEATKEACSNDRRSITNNSSTSNTSNSIISSGNVSASLSEQEVFAFLQDYMHYYQYSSLQIFVDGPCYEHLLQRVPTMPGVYVSVTTLSRLTRPFHHVIEWLRTMVTPHSATLLLLLADDADYWLQQVAFPSLFSELSWLVIGRPLSRQSLLIRLPLDNRVMFADATGSVSATGDPTMALWETYSVTDRSDMTQVRVGQWTLFGGLKAPPRDSTDRRMDLLGSQLNCVTEQQAPGIHLEQLPGGNWKVTGWIYDLMKTLEKSMNFTCTTAPAPDRQFGALQKDGSWSGMVGEVGEGRADLIVAPLDNTLARSAVVKFLVAIDLTGFIMVLKPGNQLGSVWTSYTSEFSWGVWLSVVALVVAGAVVYALVGVFSPHETFRMAPGEAFMIALGAVTSQAHPDTVSSMSGRIAHTALYFGLLLVGIHYSSWLYSTLTVFVPFFPFDGFQSLLDDGSYTVGVIQGFSIETELKKSKDPLVQRVWTELVEPQGLVPSSEEGLRKALGDKFIFLIIESEFYGGTDDPCEYLSLPQKYFKFPSGMAVKQGSPLEGVFNKALMKVIDSGVLVRTRRVWERRPPDCSDLGVAAMSLKQMVSAFFLLVFGGFLAALFFAFENLCVKIKTKKSKIV